MPHRPDETAAGLHAKMYIKTPEVLAPTLLVALPRLQETNFAKTVVLLVEQGQDGAVGMVLNRPTEEAIGDYIDSDHHDFPPGIPAWSGGPVGTRSGIVLHNQAGDSSAQLSHGDCHLSSSDIALRGLALYCRGYAIFSPRQKLPFGRYRVPNYEVLYPYRFLIGYAGWGPGQLGLEIQQGYWMEIGMNPEILFNTPWPRMWQAAMDSIGVDPMQLTHLPQPYLL